MSGITSSKAEGLVFVDRLMAKPWLCGAVKTFDKIVCCALDVFDASWEVIKDPVTEVVESAAFSTLGQFTIGCLETGVDITANVLDAVLPVGEKEKTKMPKERQDTGSSKGESSRPEIADAKKKTISRESKGARLQPVKPASASLVLALRDLQSWLNSFKLDDDDDLCGHCAKRRKVIAIRRLGPLHGLLHLSVDAVTAPLHLFGLNVNWDVLKCAVTTSGYAYLDKSPVRPKSASEKRKFPEWSSSEEEDTHTFQDDLNDYKSDEDVDYELSDKESTDSDEYAEGETESDVSIEESPEPIKAREAKKAAKFGNASQRTSQKNDDKKADKENRKSPEKKPNKGAKNANEKIKGQVNGSSADKKGGNSDVVNGEKMDKEALKSPVSYAVVKPTSPLRKLIGL